MRLSVVGRDRVWLYGTIERVDVRWLCWRVWSLDRVEPTSFFYAEQ